MAALTEPTKASGTTLGHKIAPASAFTTLAWLEDVDFGGITTAEIDTTVLASTIKTNIPSIPDPGDLSLTVKYVPAEATTISLQGLATEPKVCEWQLQSPDGTGDTTGSKAVFDGWVSSFAPKGFAVDGTPTADITIRVSGPIVFTAGT